MDEALELVDASVVAARDLGNPYWIAYTLWIAGLALSKAEPKRALATWDEAVDHVREHEVHFFEAFLARDAGRCTRRMVSSRPCPYAVRHSRRGRSHQAGNVAQLIITLASVPALFERLDRYEPAMTSVRRHLA